MLTFRSCNSSSFNISHLGGRRKSIACRQKMGSGREKSKSSSLKSTNTASHIESGASRIFGTHETSCVNAMEQRIKLQKMCLTYHLCATLQCFTLYKHKTSYSKASPSSHHCVCPNPEQAQGPLRSHNIPSPQKIHNISLHTNAFHSNLDKI